MLKLNEPTGAKVCNTEDFPQRKQWLTKMDRVAPEAVNEGLWYNLPFTHTTTAALVYHCSDMSIPSKAHFCFWVWVPRCLWERSLDILPLDYAISRFTWIFAASVCPETLSGRVPVYSVTVYHTDQSHSSERFTTGVNEAPNCNLHDPPARH